MPAANAACVITDLLSGAASANRSAAKGSQSSRHSAVSGGQASVGGGAVVSVRLQQQLELEGTRTSISSKL